MSKLAVIKTGGKQYIVREGEEITVDRLSVPDKGKVQLDTLAIIDSEKGNIELGSPLLKSPTQASVVEHGKGEKVRVARFKSKVRYRKVMGFRPSLTTLKIVKI